MGDVEEQAALFGEQPAGKIDVSVVMSALIANVEAVADYTTLLQALPRLLAHLLQCLCVLLYLGDDENLTLVSGSYDDIPGWSVTFQEYAHILPIPCVCGLPEARCWRKQAPVVGTPVATSPCPVCVPLLYRGRCIGVLTLVRGPGESPDQHPLIWSPTSFTDLMVIAGVVALLLENAHLQEHSRERIHELALLSNISSQMNSSIYDRIRLRAVACQQIRAIVRADLCDLLIPSDMEPSSWVTEPLRDLLFQRFKMQRVAEPFIIQRTMEHDPETDFFALLPAQVVTFFALPLQSVTFSPDQHIRLALSSERLRLPPVSGCIVGAYNRFRTLRSEEIALLQVLAGHTSSVMEQIGLMDAVLEARNQAGQLLRQVLDDQRFKEIILASVPAGLITTDQAGIVQSFNRAAEVILGYQSCEILGQPLEKFLHLELADVFLQEDVSFMRSSAVHDVTLVAMHSGEPQHQMVIVADRYGHELVLDVDVRPLYDDADRRIGILITFTDHTLMHRLEEEKQRLDRLASLGEMAASVAHEVRNPLASIKTSIQLLRDDLEPQDTPHAVLRDQEERVNWMRDSCAIILKEVERLDSIVRDLLLFARPGHVRRSPCLISEIINQVLDSVQRECVTSHIEIRRIYQDLPLVWIDTGQIKQVLLNLILNAVQAMPEGGTLTVFCQPLSTEQALYDIAGTCHPTQKPSGAIGTARSAYAWLLDNQVRHQELRVSQWVEIIVADSGIGILPDQLQHIFQPFYTTKAHGIGLGLAITRRLIEDHGGYLRMQSQYGAGTSLSVRLPLVEDDPATLKPVESHTMFRNQQTQRESMHVSSAQ